jgi:hypothetical protein
LFLGFYQIVVLRGQEIVALFRLLVFINGHKVDRAKFIHPFLQS